LAGRNAVVAVLEDETAVLGGAVVVGGTVVTGCAVVRVCVVLVG